MIDKLISFELCGRFAHFRKFYTNSSSLTYLLPPKTVIIGLLASILQKPRDSYYDLFNEENTKIAISLNSKVKKQMQSMNYLHNDYYKFLTGGTATTKHHSQCKLELLSGVDNQLIRYKVYVWHDSLYDKLLAALKNDQLGYGIYLGQRQFSAFIEHVKEITTLKYLEDADFLGSAILKENLLSLGLNDSSQIVSELMPSQMKPELEEIKKSINKNGADLFEDLAAPKIIGREPIKTSSVVFESSGQRINGKFKNCWCAEDKIISFY